jgi:SAM-dependent methyltransferase
MQALLDAALANPWQTLDTIVDDPLHPGGTAATERLLDRAGVADGTRLLEVGCGAGDALEVAGERGVEAVGLDVNPSTDGAVRGDATALPVRNRSVDVVLAECVLCLTDLSRALAESGRVLRDGGRLAVSDVVVECDRPPVPDGVAEALCLTGARSRDRLVAELDEAGFTVRSVRDHHDDLLAMREQVRERVDYEGLLGAMGERGKRIRDGIDDLETAVESGEIGYVSVVADV